MTLGGLTHYNKLVMPAPIQVQIMSKTTSQMALGKVPSLSLHVLACQAGMTKKVLLRFRQGYG